MGNGKGNMMDCNFVKTKIEEFVYEKKIRPDDDLIRHITGCPECQFHLKSCQAANKITLLLVQHEPVISDPQKLATDILNAINELEPQVQNSKIYILSNVKKILVAASFALFAIFAFEQYVFIHKLIKLEAAMSSVPTVSSNTDFYKKVFTYYPDKGMEMVKSELAAQGLKSKKMNFKTLIMTAGYSVLSSDEILKQVQTQSAPDQGLNDKKLMRNQ